MKRTIYCIFALAAGLLLTLSCVEERLVETPSVEEGSEGILSFDFGPTESIQVETRSSVDKKYEMQVHNFYLFVFDSSGAKVVGHYFNSENEVSSTDDLTLDNCWYVKNASDDDLTTTGTVRLKISTGSDMKIYMLANLDADMVKVSSDLLSSSVATEDDLKKFNVYMNQMIVTRNGYFPMFGVLKGVNITASESTSSTTTLYIVKDSDGSNAVLKLKRLDAKIHFIVKKGDRKDEKGQTCESFEPISWQVLNVPRTTYAMGYDDRGLSETCGMDIVSVDPTTDPSEYSKYASNFFDTKPLTFETYTSSTQSEFTFYMLENRQKPKKTAVVENDPVKSYQNRSRRIKIGEDGTDNELNKTCTVNYTINGKSYERTMRCFEYMNDFSTYVILRGRVTMALNGDDAGQNLGAEVSYLIPLGNWSSTINNDDDTVGDAKDTYGNVDDYNIIRNYSYTYTVTVNSVHNIRVEVDSSNDGSTSVTENQPGAYGDVTVAKEEIAICDAHYVSKTLNFHLKNFFERGNISQDYDISDQLTWSIKTPFGEGEPRTEGDLDITDGLDFRWVHFRLNKKDESTGIFKTARRKYVDRVFETSTAKRDSTDNKEGDGVTPGLGGYHNDGIMDVQYLVKYMKDQVKRYLEDPQTSDFDKTPTEDGGPKISVTVFVDEYYYDKNPLTNETSPTLWKTFVNADDRKLHILCNSNLSKDLESRSTGSVITIQQHSIQCIFNTDASNTDLKTAWGVENVDEYEKGLREKDSSTGKYTKSPYGESTSTSYTSENRGNSDSFNGLLNTAKEWGLCGASSTSFNTGSTWDTYMALEVDNDTPQLNDDHSYLRYSCMTRNRDNNGNGKIDREELRWYMASVQQLIGLFVGKNLLNRSTQLYNVSMDVINNTTSTSDQTTWQQHVVSSTMFGSNSNDPTIVWAEEGVSTSNDLPGWNVMQQYETVRCVRNLGYFGENNDVADETYDLGETPQNYVEVTDSDNGKIYDSSNLNTKAHRYYSSKELPLHKETDIDNQLYQCFESSSATQATSSYKFQGFNEAVDEEIANGGSICPEGWRVPNQVELAVMRYYGNETTKSFCRTYYSFGTMGKNIKNSTCGFSLNSNFKMTAANDEAYEACRCVRDVRVD